MPDERPDGFAVEVRRVDWRAAEEGEHVLAEDGLVIFNRGLAQRVVAAIDAQGLLRDGAEEGSAGQGCGAWVGIQLDQGHDLALTGFSLGLVAVAFAASLAVDHEADPPRLT